MKEILNRGRAIRVLRNLLITAVIFSGAGCRISDPNAVIIRGYRAAGCLPLAAESKILPPTREWHSTVVLHDGSPVLVYGAAIPGGRIALMYRATQHRVFAAEPGDYVYPSDVRFDKEHDYLYVKAHGLAGGVFDQTWMFQFDLSQRRLLDRELVDASSLPGECSGPMRPE